MSAAYFFEYIPITNIPNLVPTYAVGTADLLTVLKILEDYSSDHYISKINVSLLKPSDIRLRIDYESIYVVPKELIDYHILADHIDYYHWYQSLIINKGTSIAIPAANMFGRLYTNSIINYNYLHKIKFEIT